MIAALRIVATLYLAIGFGSVVWYVTWLEGIEGFLAEWQGPQSGARFWLGLITTFVVGLVLDVILWPLNVRALRGGP
jgi:hypothetical protein